MHIDIFCHIRPDISTQRYNQQSHKLLRVGAMELFVHQFQKFYSRLSLLCCLKVGRLVSKL